MATKIHVVYADGETPFEGAEVLVGGIGGSALTTGVRGNCSLPELAEGWEGYVDVRVDNGTSIATATLHIVEGESHTVQLGVQST